MVEQSEEWVMTVVLTVQGMLSSNHRHLMWVFSHAPSRNRQCNGLANGQHDV